MAIVRTRLISFTMDRVASLRKIRLGNESDNMVERLRFALPMIAEHQTATLVITGRADLVRLNYDEENGYYVDLTAEIVGPDGETEAYVRIDGDAGEAWSSNPFRLITGALPDVSEEIEQRFPTAVETMLTEIAGHREDMADALNKAEDAAQRAEDAAANAGQGSGGAAAQKAVLYTEQSLTDGQKAQARRNIAVYSKAEVDALIPEETDLSGYYTKEETDAAIDAATDKGQWEKIENITIEEEGVATVSRTAFPDGTFYNLAAAKVMVKIHYPIPEQIGTSCKIKSGSKTMASMVQSAAKNTSTNTNSAHSLVFQAKPNAGIYEFVSATGNQGGNMEMSYPVNNTGQVEKTEQKITEISFDVWMGGSIPVGTTIEIWGVRA